MNFLPKSYNEERFLKELLTTCYSAGRFDELLEKLPIVPENQYTYTATNPEQGWQKGKLHWIPVGRDYGNQGRIQLAGAPEYPIAERATNSAEAIIELHRQIELQNNDSAAPPGSPREAALRYLGLPPLGELPFVNKMIDGKPALTVAREIARQIRVNLIRNPKTSSRIRYTVQIEDDGIGQVQNRLHSSILSLGASDKADKRYMIGIFGQGGSSAYSASHGSWIVSRRHPLLKDSKGQLAGWSMVKKFHSSRRVYWAYLAASPNGEVPGVSVETCEKLGLKGGTRISHIGYDFGKTEPARTLYQSLNHLMCDPILPVALNTKGPGGRPDLIMGNAYRLSKLNMGKKRLDKTYPRQMVLVK